MASRDAATGKHKGMLFLEAGNRIIADLLTKRFEKLEEGEKLEALADTLCDFDGVRFRLVAEKETPHIVSVSMNVPSFSELAVSGAPELLEEEYSALMTTPRDGADVTLEFDMSSPPLPPADLVEKVCRLRRVAVGAPFTRAFRALAAGKSADVPASHVHHHGSESLFVIPRPEKVTVVYGLEFADITDRAMARVIAQEFVEAQRHVNGAPPVLFSRDPPLELTGLTLPVTDAFVGFLNFGVLPKHVDTAAKLETAVTLMSGFRNYIHYHIKAAKSYLHIRMRARVQAMLGVLNVAIPEQPDKEKKLMDGRTFVRKV